MVAPVIVVAVSGSVAVVLIVLFRYEQARGVRYIEGARKLFDRSVRHAELRLKSIYRLMTGQTIRQSIHYLFHQVLSAILHQIQRLEDTVHTVARFNKDRANHRKNSVSPSHLSVMADHKRSTQLTDAQKQQRRDEVLNGR